MRFAVIIAFLLLLAGCIDRSTAARPQLLNSSLVYNGPGNVLGTKWDTAQVVLQFDQELYTSHMIILPDQEKDCPPPPDCQPCDLTASGASPCNTNCCGLSAASPAELSEWCNPSQPFTALNLNEPSPLLTMQRGEERFFRFYLPPETWCSPIRVQVSLASGQVWLFLSDSSPYPNITNSILFRTTTYGRNFGYVTMGPWFDGSVGQGTVALALTAPFRSVFSIEVIVPQAKMPFKPATPPPADACQNIPSEYVPQGTDTPLICLTDSVTNFQSGWPSGTELQTIFSLEPGCHTFSFTVYGLNFSTTGVDVDLYCMPMVSDSVNLFENTVLGSWTYKEDEVTMSTCSDERVWVRCDAEIWSLGPFAMLFSTAGPVIRRPITALSPYDYTTWAGKDSMVLVAPGSRVLTSTACIDWTSGCSLYFPSYPTFDSLRFWPPPTVITSSNIYEDLLPPIFPLPFLTTPLPGRYVLTIVLSSPSSTRFTSLQSLLDIEGLVLVATNLVNAEGEAVQLPNDLTQRSAQDMITPYFPHMKLTSVPRNHPPCTWPAFSAIGAVGVSLNSQLTNQSAVVLPPRYQLDLLASSDTFVWCRSAALDLLVNDTSSSLVLDSSCQYMPGTADFMDDPCCNPVLLSIYCCAPRPSLQAVTTYSDPSAAELKTCTHPECSQSLLSTLAQNLNQVTAGIACTAAPSAREQSRELTKMLTPLATCRQESGIGVNFDGVPCQQDADCARFNASCGVFSRICELTDLDLVEALYIDCFIDNVTDTYLLNWLKLNVLPASVRDLDKNDPLMKAAIMDAATQSDCLGPWPLDISRRSRSIEAVQSSLCATNILTRYITDPTPADYERECGQFECLGTSCQQPPRTCFNYCTRVTTEYTSSQELCDQPSTCRFDDCDNANVCAYCPLDTSKPCIVNTSITSPQQCQQTRVCELDDGSFVWGLSEAECQALTFCTVDCLGTSCRSGWLLAGVCQATGATSAVACNNIAAGDPLWYQNTTCLLPGLTTRTDCLQADASYQWDTCQQQSVCSSSASPVASYLACFQDQYRDCQSQQECESAGACSDIQWTKIADNGTVRYGACFTPGARTGSLLTSGSSGTLCLNDQVRTTNGCRISRASVPNAVACQPDLGNGVAAAAWLTPITDQATCENVTGCNIFEYEDVRYSWRDAAECEACGGVPTREWQWTPGVWRHSASRTPSWQPRARFAYNYEPALSFQTTESWIVDAITQQFDLLLRSEVVCQNNLVRIPLFPVVCDCYSDTENCFDILSPFTLISLAYPCALTRSETLFGLNSITFYENSVPAGCVLTYIFAISRRSFDAPPLPPQVSFRLAAKQTRTDSAVQNTKGITVGEVSGDGVRIVKRGPLNIFELCLQVVKWPTGAYPVRDFGTTTQELSVVRPLDVQGGEERQLLNQTFFCANLTAEQWEDVYRNSTLYIIPIIRETNWQSSSKSSSYSTTDRALIYTLAAEYLLCIIFLTMFCGVAFWFWYTTKQGRMLLFFAGLFWLFLCIFRVVYLFAYPEDAISDPLANYAVWELPSFFYFTAFSIILATWFEGTVPKPLQKRARYGIIIVINAFCICLFVSVMIAFAILNSEADTNPSACPGRVEGTPTSKSSDIRTLSLVYQSVMIAISFLMALAFVYSLLQVSLSSRNLGLSWERTYSRAKNLFHIAVFTVVGFLTRCILFIILLSIDLTSTIYLFITLTITEVFVICAVCSQFQILRIAGHRLRSTSASPSGARSSHVRDTSLTSFSSSPSPDTHS